MATWRPKKIIFIGTQSSLLKILAKDNETEVISSVSFLETLAMRFLPDLIVADFLTAESIMQIRKTERFAFIPILLSAEKITMNEVNATIAFPNIIVCNSTLCTQDIFIEHLKAIMTKTKSILPAKTGAIIKKTVCFVDENIGKKFTRKEITNEIGTDRDYLTRIFHREMGIGLWDYINIIRLEEAKNLLTYTGIPVKEIAQRCGFSTSAYFCNCFRKHFHISPSDLRITRDFKTNR
ncbi:helix-turn-helix transcriptional regulator [Treponema sp.]|uniref:helix-turn-helix transcriptional regulator n=1 Tax=Treponema sp. TaxID=166 RepID=UPI00388EB32C